MTEEEKKDIEETKELLKQLDYNDLTIIKYGINLLAARSSMEKQEQTKRQERGE